MGFPKTYRGKIMLVAFLGTHTPLLGAALYLLLGSSVGLGAALRILALLVTVTLAGTADTLLAKADAAMYQAKREGRAWVLAD